MEVRQAIHDLHFSLEHTIAEDELVGVIADRLPALRKAYPSYRSSFAPDDIDFLKSLGVIWDLLQDFIELKEELASVSDLKEYDEMDSRLTQALGPLAHYPVGRRIAKELRGLKERLPAIREQDEARQQDRRNVRILDFQPRQSRAITQWWSEKGRAAISGDVPHTRSVVRRSNSPTKKTIS